jgi:hypothetical protein
VLLMIADLAAIRFCGRKSGCCSTRHVIHYNAPDATTILVAPPEQINDEIFETANSRDIHDGTLVWVAPALTCGCWSEM